MTSRPTWLRWLQRRMPHSGDDRGAAMIYAMLFVTVIAVAVAAVLGLAEANIRATEQLRVQAAQNAAADGAAQVAINELRRGTFVGPEGDCFTSGATLQVPNVTQVQGGGTLSAVVRCERDDDTSVIPSIPTFDYGLLTLPGTGEDGITVSVNGSGASFTVDGSISSTGRVHADHGALRISRAGATFAAADCQIDTTASIWNGTTQITESSAACNNAAGAAADPNLALPADAVPGALGTVRKANCTGGTNPTTCNNAPACDNVSCLNTSTYCDNSPARFTFTPGVYNDPRMLNTPYGCSSGQVYEFKPGVYFFNFNSSTASDNRWTVGRGTTVAGFDGTLSSPVTPFPGKCDSPYGSSPHGGALFVFGAQSRLLVTNNARFEICARDTLGTSRPPIAIYGLKTAVGEVLAQTGCVTTTGGSGCPVLQIARQGNTNPEVRVYGTTYLPQGWVDLDLSTTSLTLQGGVVARRFAISSPGSGTVAADSVKAAPVLSGPSRTVVDLTVYVCPDASTCSTSAGTLRLKVKVALGPPDNRDVKIYSWSAA